MAERLLCYPLVVIYYDPRRHVYWAPSGHSAWTFRASTEEAARTYYAQHLGVQPSEVGVEERAISD